MLKRPRFKPHYHIEVIEGEGVFVLSETEQTVLQGRLYEQVAPLLDGRPLERLREQLSGRLAPARLFYTLNVLEQKGYLCEADDGAVNGDGALWSLQGLDPTLVTGRLAETSIRVEAVGVPAEPLRALLASLGLGQGETVDLNVVVADHYLRRELEARNIEALRSSTPWLLVRAAGSQVWIGPLFVPGKTGCWECLAERIRGNYPVIGYLDNIREEGMPGFVRGGNLATQAIAWGLAAQAIASWVAHGKQFDLLEGKIQSLDLTIWQTQSHVLLRQPACAACGICNGHASHAIAPLALASRKKAYTDDGGHRAQSPQETIDHYGHHVSPICGAVSALDCITPPGADVMHVYVSGHNVARSPGSLSGLKVDLRNSSCGKGMTDLQARASALCEGLERYSGNFRGDEPRRRARFVDLPGDAIHPNACMLFSDRQYQIRDEENARGTIFHNIPRPFDPEAVIEWTPVWSLTHGAVRYLPTSFCYFEYPHDCRNDFCVACSNGNAAGNTIEEAILQGFLELVERDSVALWWYNRPRLPGVDLDSFHEPYLARLRDCLAKYGRDLWALDLTSDLNIPVYAALSHRPGAPAEQIMFGFGAHLDPRIAMLRAVTELNQMLSHLLDAPPDGPPKELSDEDTLEWLMKAKLAEHSYLVPGEGARRGLADHPYAWTDDLKQDVELCQARVEALGLEVLVLNQTRPEIGLPVVKVIVPGLRHFWRRWAPGRLYDVPVRLGWLAAPLSEGQLNPFPMFL
jgi:ribosomal protein S12 methylthiotransferase accessory factor